MMERTVRIASYTFLIAFGIVMIYPILWMIAAAFRTNAEIFTSIDLIPKEFVWDSFVKGWQGTAQFTYTTFFKNSFLMVIPTVIGTIVSSVVVAYGFTRFNFPLKNLLFMLVISTLMLPHAVVIIPRYLMFNQLGWLNSYLPFIVPSFLGSYPFFIFMMIQFLRGLPKELDESAKIDGCNSFTILTKILLPLCKPAIFSVTIIQFIWLWNEFFNTLIYVNSVSKYTLPLALRMSIDATSVIQWNEVMAMSVLTMLPCVIIFFAAQKYFVEGIATTGFK